MSVRRLWYGWLVEALSWCFAGTCIMALVIVCTGWLKTIPATENTPAIMQWVGPIHPLFVFFISTVFFYLFSKWVDYIDQKKKEENSSVGGDVYHVGPFEEGPASSPVGNDQTNFSGVILSVYDGGDAGGGGGDAGGGE